MMNNVSGTIATGDAVDACAVVGDVNGFVVVLVGVVVGAGTSDAGVGALTVDGVGAGSVTCAGTVVVGVGGLGAIGASTQRDE